MSIFALSNYCLKFNNCSHEKDISAVEKKKSKQAWFQGKNVHSEWQEGFGRPQGKGQKEINRFL